MLIVSEVAIDALTTTICFLSWLSSFPPSLFSPLKLPALLEHRSVFGGKEEEEEEWKVIGLNVRNSLVAAIAPFDYTN